MRYKNVKTGAIIDSPSKIIGKAWQLVDEETLYNQKGEDISGGEEVPTEEYVEEEINLEEMTNKELEELAKKEGINLTAEDKKNKKTRIEAIVKAFE